MIISRSGDTMVVKGAEGKTIVVLNEQTDTKDDAGLFGWDKDHLGSTVLMPGLKVKVEGAPDSQGRIVATQITVDGDDLETTQMIEAGLHPTAEQVEANLKTLHAHAGDIATNQQGIAANQGGVQANKQQISENMKDIEENSSRFKALDDYDVKGQTTVKFAVGSTKISDEDGEQLKQLGQTAMGTSGLLVEVVGYADSTGDAAMNTQLSEKRAKEVINFLVQQCKVPIRYIVAPGAMGEYGEASSNESKEGRAENRRVEVKVLSNKGIAGSTT
ncbi:MAG TPA: OmpA family protein [Terracidiphilus sp.]|jgi:outer membrane protein OmpA-like peptidoglycan-associated protein